MIIGDFQSPVSNTCVVEWLVTTQTNTVSKQDFQGAKSIHISLQHSIHGVAILIVQKTAPLAILTVACMTVKSLKRKTAENKN